MELPVAGGGNHIATKWPLSSLENVWLVSEWYNMGSIDL